MLIPLQEVEYIFFSIIYTYILIYFHSRSRTILQNIFHVSERKCDVLLSLASDRANRMREVLFTRPYVGRKRDGERDIKVFRLIFGPIIGTGYPARIYPELTGRYRPKLQILARITNLPANTPQNSGGKKEGRQKIDVCAKLI